MPILRVQYRRAYDVYTAQKKHFGNFRTKKAKSLHLDFRYNFFFPQHWNTAVYIALIGIIRRATGILYFPLCTVHEDRQQSAHHGKHP